MLRHADMVGHRGNMASTTFGYERDPSLLKPASGAVPATSAETDGRQRSGCPGWGMAGASFGDVRSADTFENKPPDLTSPIHDSES